MLIYSWMFKEEEEIIKKKKRSEKIEPIFNTVIVVTMQNSHYNFVNSVF